MRRALLTILGTAAIFAAGVFAGWWMQRHPPVPPPPIGLMGEIRDVPLSGTQVKADDSARLSQLQAEMERMKPEIEAFREKLKPIKADFRAGLEKLLTPEQMLILKELRERGSSTPSASSPEPKTSKEGQSPHAWKGHAGMDAMFPIVLVPVTLERLTEKLHLNAAQKEEVRKLLILRRERFLDLVDSSPPPSTQLSKIAPLVPKLSDPPPQPH